MAVAIKNLLSHQHITFDVWNTLIKANHEFSRIRTEAIAAAYDISFEEAKETYTSVKHFLDHAAELGGICLSTPKCWLLLDSTIQRLRRKKGLEPETVDTIVLSDYCNDMFRQNLPILTEGTIDVLKRLKANGHRLAIISNTNFIPGSLLFSELFEGLNVFDTAVFSDSFGHAKPNFNTFDSARYSLAREDDEQICHVGDNLICDGGATRAGYSFQHVTDPDNLVEIFNKAGL